MDEIEHTKNEAFASELNHLAFRYSETLGSH